MRLSEVQLSNLRRVMDTDSMGPGTHHVPPKLQAVEHHVDAIAALQHGIGMDTWAQGRIDNQEPQEYIQVHSMCLMNISYLGIRPFCSSRAFQPTTEKSSGS